MSPLKYEVLLAIIEEELGPEWTVVDIRNGLLLYQSRRLSDSPLLSDSLLANVRAFERKRMLLLMTLEEIDRYCQHNFRGWPKDLWSEIRRGVKLFGRGANVDPDDLFK